MSKKKRNRIRFFLVLGIALLFVGIPVGFSASYKAKHKKTTSEESNINSSITIVEAATIKDISEPKLFVSDKTVFCENGAVYEDFNACTNVYVSYSYDRTKAAVTADDMLYYIDGNLRPVRVTRKCKSYGMMGKNGRYILYYDEVEHGLYRFDTYSQKKTNVTYSYSWIEEVAFSFNSRYVSSYDFAVKNLVISDTDDNNRHKIVSGQELEGVAVSVEGDQAFYRYSDGNYKTLYSYHDGELSNVYYGKNYRYVFTKDCSEIFIYGVDGLWYYNTSMEKAVKILDENVEKLHFAKEISGTHAPIADRQYIDSDTLNCCFIEAENYCYYYTDANRKLITVGDKNYVDYYSFDGDSFNYLLQNYNHIYKGRIYNGHLEEDLYVEIEYPIRSYAANDDLSIIWFVDRDYGLHRYKDNYIEDLGRISESDYTLKYVSSDRKLYYFDDDILFSVDEDTDEIKKEYDNCVRTSTTNLKYNDFIRFTTKSGDSLVEIYGNIVKLNDRK
ncbi:hypothetical protein [Butyrivibrio sp. VCB2006]|uniref:hypothetical protein n=1 Tax=Butyrivibrio sp. VCB2006 TaxID=1280679 RepID=UPI000492D1A7|nr:hypothetical protein [Butyrivibrio sp. VCB2006]